MNPFLFFLVASLYSVAMGGGSTGSKNTLNTYGGSCASFGKPVPDIGACCSATGNFTTDAIPVLLCGYALDTCNQDVYTNCACNEDSDCPPGLEVCRGSAGYYSDTLSDITYGYSNTCYGNPGPKNTLQTAAFYPQTANECFAGSELVELDSGVLLKISEVKLGDRVRVVPMDASSSRNNSFALAFFSPVIYLPHSKNEIIANFVQLFTQQGKDIKLTEKHLILSSLNCDPSLSLTLVEAGKLKVGDCVQTMRGLEVISRRRMVAGKGLYTVVLLDGELIVINGIIASPFVTNHRVVNAFYSLHRVIYSLCPWLLRNRRVNEMIARFGVLAAEASF